MRRNGIGMVALPALLALGLGACGDSPTGTAGTTPVAVRFTAARTTSAMQAAPSASSPAIAADMASAGELVIDGTNGTLTITGIHMIVDKIELEAENVAVCDGEGTGDTQVAGETESSSGEDDGCEEFESPPSFLDLPLDAGAVTVSTTQIPDGTYDKVKFETKDIEVDQSDEDEGETNALAGDVLAAYPDWPSNATMVVEGTFTPTGGTPQAFTTYIDSEIEVELMLDPPLTVNGGVASRSVTVDLDPAGWFLNGDGTVIDLSQFDFATYGRALDFEQESENAFDDGFEAESD